MLALGFSGCVWICVAPVGSRQRQGRYAVARKLHLFLLESHYKEV